MNVGDLVQAMESIAPTRFAAPWDNVGLLVGDPRDALSRALLAVDCTRAVLEEAARGGFGAVVAYHPPIFEPQRSFLAGSIAHDAARARVALYSPHTALDAADGGTNDALADALGMQPRAPLRAAAAPDAEHKLVTFVPPERADDVAEAMFAHGAGRIGRYSGCSFRAPGSGTFYGEEGARPAVGQAGRREVAPELRLETVVPIDRAEAVVRAMRAAHPYEEPAFDLVRLAAPPGGPGYGRVGAVPAASIAETVARVKRALDLPFVLMAGDGEREVTRAAVCAGSGGDLVKDAIAAGALLYLTGELRHGEVLRALSAGMAVVCTRHSASERVALGALERMLAARLPGVELRRSGADLEPLTLA